MRKDTEDKRMVSAEKKPLLEVQDLKTYFPIRVGLFGRTAGFIRAVDGVSFRIEPGQTLGLVGESGCGKTTVGRTILRLIPAVAGRVFFDGMDILSIPSGRLKPLRRQMQIMFQDPYGSLNPRMNVEAIVGGPLKVHGLASGQQRRQRVVELLEQVGLSRRYLDRYPHEFSGGQRQRIGIARALALGPKFLVCDEPVSALDVSIQSQIINLLMDLQKQLKLTYLFIAHDLAVVRHISDRVAVMYLGRIVEQAARDALFERPLHPYTQALLSAIPVPEPGRRRKRIVLKGEVPSPANPPSGCPFHPRCPLAEARCAREEQTLVEYEKDRWAACWKAGTPLD
ncbi:MAG TPA: dipeptide ABC transporter ATP-binding protein [Anaerohalosphaeraceae bacterium]|nr:dipeptide ABC transporter ATP-binding protein [Anaerohalosphaeraceae bacterium]